MQGKARQDKTKQGKARQGKTRQDKAKQDKTRQDKTRQDKTRQDKSVTWAPTLSSSSLGAFIPAVSCRRYCSTPSSLAVKVKLFSPLRRDNSEVL